MLKDRISVTHTKGQAGVHFALQHLITVWSPLRNLKLDLSIARTQMNQFSGRCDCAVIKSGSHCCPFRMLSWSE